jgi:hypothetical protein
VTNPARSLWHKIREPRPWRISGAIGYASVLVAGVWALAQPIQSFQEVFVLGFLGYIWASILVLGGALGLAFVFTTAWKAERGAIILCAGGVLIYCLAAFSLVGSGGNRGTQAFILLALAALLVGRAFTAKIIAQQALLSAR